MATLLSGNQVKLNNGQIVTAQEGGYYDAQPFVGGKLLAAGLDIKGNPVSDAVIAQTNPNNVSFVHQQQQINAGDLQSPVSLSLPSAQSSPTAGLLSDVAATKDALTNSIAAQKATIDAKLADLQKVQDNALTQIQDLSTPFRQNLEATQRDSLYINQNFEANQKLTDELDTLLTQGNDLIKQQQGITGLSAIRNPRVQQTMSDIAARAGVIQAVMAARNSQISVAENMIDRSVNAIQADRQDQISYYKTVLDLNKQDMLSLDTQSQKLADAQLSILQDSYTRAQDTADYIKKLMVNPDYASLMGEAGVTLNDSVDTINAKLKAAQDTQTVIKQANEITSKGGQLVIDPRGVPKDQLVSFKGPDGTTYYYQMPTSTTSGAKGGITQTTINNSLDSYTWQRDSQGNSISPFMQLVYEYANSMTLDAIYKYYMQSPYGKKFGAPTEDKGKIQAIYDNARGNG